MDGAVGAGERSRGSRHLSCVSFKFMNFNKRRCSRTFQSSEDLLHETCRRLHLHPRHQEVYPAAYHRSEREGASWRLPGRMKVLVPFPPGEERRC